MESALPKSKLVLSSAASVLSGISLKEKDTGNFGKSGALWKEKRKSMLQRGNDLLPLRFSILLLQRNMIEKPDPILCLSK